MSKLTSTPSRARPPVVGSPRERCPSSAARRIADATAGRPRWPNAARRELVDRRDQPSLVAANMRRQQLAVRPHGLGKRHQLRRVGIGAWRIHQAKRQSRRAVGQLAVEHRLHRGTLRRRGGAPLISHHGEAQRRVSDQRDKVERDAAPVQFIPVACQAVEHFVGRHLAEQCGEMLPQQFSRLRRGRIQRKAAIAHDHGGHALSGFLGTLRLAQTHQVVMAMRVDEAGRQVSPVGVERLGIIDRQ